MEFYALDQGAMNGNMKGLYAASWQRKSDSLPFPYFIAHLSLLNWKRKQ
jgi:hypothetical protein